MAVITTALERSSLTAPFYRFSLLRIVEIYLPHRTPCNRMHATLQPSFAIATCARVAWSALQLFGIAITTDTDYAKMHPEDRRAMGISI